MQAILLDNYRGFSKTIIPLKKVNFLVGENSTGKTSLLSIMKLFGSPRFWFNPNFNDPDISFSTFREIISINSSNKNYFTIGYLLKKEHDNNKSISLKLITFKNKNGIPAVYKFSLLSDIGLINCIIREKTILFKVTPISDDKITSQLLLELLSIHKNKKTTGYSSIKNEGSLRDVFFSNAESIVKSEIAGKTISNNKKEIKFNIHMDFPTVSWVAPIRAKPEKLYQNYTNNFSPEGLHVPHILNRLIFDNKSAKKKSKILKSIISFGKSSGMFENIDIKRYGNNVSAPFEMHVLLDKKPLLINNVGYGVSQVLPILLETRARGAFYVAIQQPEVHLHPKAQASLGEVFFSSSMELHKQYIIETHSDYLIDRFRICINKSNSYIDSQILFFERGEYGNKVHPIKINSDGSYSEDQPIKFRDFFLNEEMTLLEL